MKNPFKTMYSKFFGSNQNNQNTVFSNSNNETKYSKDELITIGYNLLNNYPTDKHFTLRDIFDSDNVPKQLKTNYALWGGIATKAIKSNVITKSNTKGVYIK